MDHHTVATISATGICLDMLGGLYLAYDLLGGQGGPLRLLTRIVTYSVVFGTGYAVGLGLFFGIASGLASGTTVAMELHRTARHGDHYPLQWEAVFSIIRAAAFGAGLYRILGLEFALSFAFLVAAGQTVAYIRGIRPGLDYSATGHPRFTRLHLETTVLRTVAHIAAAMICSTIVGHVDHAWAFALRVGVVTGIVTAMGVASIPFIEHFADNLPERRLGAFGVWLVLCGFVLQSVQYWVAIFDIPVS